MAQYDLIYSVKRPLKTCGESYNGEIGRRLAERAVTIVVEIKGPTCISIPSRKTIQLRNFKTLKSLVKDLDKKNSKGGFQRHFSLKKISSL